MFYKLSVFAALSLALSGSASPVPEDVGHRIPFHTRSSLLTKSGKFDHGKAALQVARDHKYV